VQKIPYNNVPIVLVNLGISKKRILMLPNAAKAITIIEVLDS
jgi:hypothetical protein